MTRLHTLCRTAVAALMLAATALPAAAEDDFGIWTDLSAEKKINKQFAADLSVGFRAEDRLNHDTRWSVGTGLSYKPVKGLKLSAGYILIRDFSLSEAKAKYKDNGNLSGYNVDHGFWRTKHRFTFDISGKHTFGRLTVGLRERFQMTHSNSAKTLRDKYRSPKQPGFTGETWTYNGTEFCRYELDQDDKSGKTTYYLRSRLSAEYDIRHCPLTPYAAVEWSHSLDDAMALAKTRLTLGTDWKISKKHSVSLAYIYQDGAGDDDSGTNNIHVIEVGYKFSF
ncbi:MAG: DUF2490 domain-containing protein [Bacteroidales bacterium]|nr:DUF2490 domain-containing protein [Bacteroidales bacterium]